MRPGVFHYYISDAGCEYAVIEIAVGYINRFYTAEAAAMLLRCFDATVMPLEESEIGRCLRLAEAARPDGDGTATEKFTAIGSLLSLLCGKQADAPRSERTDTDGAPDEKLRSVTDYIAENLKNIHSIADITGNCYISRSQLFRIFSKELGQSVSSYVNNLKIDAARDMLLRGSTVTDAAMECGFNSLQYFHKLFKERLGCSPKEYVRRYR